MIVQPTPANIQHAARLLQAGELIGLPTETVYGVGADARNPEAVKKIFSAKGRPTDHPLIVHLAHTDQLSAWARDIPPSAFTLAKAFWPGPLTLILKRAHHVQDAVTGGQDTIGLRIPAHPVARAVIEASGTGIAAPSANRFGRISPTTAEHVKEELGEKLALILDGGSCHIGIESTIIDLSRGIPIILRPGAITPENIRKTLPTSDESTTSTSLHIQNSVTPRASGTLAAHYAPRTPLHLVPASELVSQLAKLTASGYRIGILSYSLTPDPHNTLWYTLPPFPEAYAHALYMTLRTLDALKADCLLVESVPASLSWQAISDRLGRAAASSDSL